MDSLEALIAKVEAAGFDWAIERASGKHYGAVVEKAPSEFIGDDLQYCGARGGDTPYLALLAAFTDAQK